MLLLRLIFFIAVWIVAGIGSTLADQACRFAFSFSGEQLFSNITARQLFFSQWAERETHFMRTIGIDQATAMTYDGHRLDLAGGMPLGKPHMFSAASKESLHVGILAKTLEGTDPIIKTNATFTVSEALQILEKKVTSFESFNEKFPGFGGFFPWVSYDGNGSVTPTWDWHNRVPSLDNGELFWSAFAVSAVLSKPPYFPQYASLAARWTQVWQRMVKNAVKVFYAGNGNVRTVTNIQNETWPVDNNTYTGSPSWLNDPYEGELFTVMLYLFSPDLNSTEKAQLWINKRVNLQAVNLTLPFSKNITVQRGYWFSAHEQWKYLMLPYHRSETNWAVFQNGERARSYYSAVSQRCPGLYASVNGPIATDGDKFPYFSDCGIPAIAFEPVTHDAVVTPYGAFPLFLVSEAHAVVWFHNMISAPKGQNCFGTTESFNVTGSTVAPLTTWDSKITTLFAAMKGVVSIVEAAFTERRLLENFTSVVEGEWHRVFPTLPLPGSTLPIAVPKVSMPKVLNDFTSCSVMSPQCPN